jgi:hypothetical protein
MKKILIALILISPLQVFAFENVKNLIKQLITTINMIVPLLLSVAVVCFAWGVLKYISSGSPEKIKDARKYIVFSVIAITVMLSIWSLVLLVQSTLFPTRIITPRNGVPDGKDYYPELPGGIDNPNSPIPPDEIMPPTENA